MTAKRLLAEATAETLREWADDAEHVARGDIYPDERAALLGLAALAEAVAKASEFCVWIDVSDSHMPEPRLSSDPAGPSLPAALSTLLPTEDTTDGR